MAIVQAIDDAFCPRCDTCPPLFAATLLHASLRITSSATLLRDDTDTRDSSIQAIEDDADDEKCSDDEKDSDANDQEAPVTSASARHALLSTFATSERREEL